MWRATPSWSDWQAAFWAAVWGLACRVPRGLRYTRWLNWYPRMVHFDRNKIRNNYNNSLCGSLLHLHQKLQEFRKFQSTTERKTFKRYLSSKAASWYGFKSYRHHTIKKPMVLSSVIEAMQQHQLTSSQNYLSQKNVRLFWTALLFPPTINKNVLIKIGIYQYKSKIKIQKKTWIFSMPIRISTDVQTLRGDLKYVITRT